MDRGGIIHLIEAVRAFQIEMRVLEAKLNQVAAMGVGADWAQAGRLPRARQRAVEAREIFVRRFMECLRWFAGKGNGGSCEGKLRD